MDFTTPAFTGSNELCAKYTLIKLPVLRIIIVHILIAYTYTRFHSYLKLYLHLLCVTHAYTCAYTYTCINT